MFGKRKSADLFPGQIEIGTIEATPGVDLRKLLEETRGVPVTDEDMKATINSLSDLNRKALADLAYIQPIPDATHPN